MILKAFKPSIKELAPFIEEAIAQGKDVRLTVTGYSMYPLLRSGTDDVVLKKHDELKKYDYSDAQKDLLVGMTYGLTNPLLTYSEYEDIDFEKNLTYCDAYLYITRLLMDSSGCQRISHEYLVPIDSEVLFGVMYEKGLLDEIKLENAQKDIPRQEFYSLLHKALFCDFIRGGYINNRYRYIDGLIEKYINENTVNEAQEIMEKNGMRKS